MPRSPGPSHPAVCQRGISRRVGPTAIWRRAMWHAPRGMCQVPHTKHTKCGPCGSAPSEFLPPSPPPAYSATMPGTRCMPSRASGQRARRGERVTCHRKQQILVILGIGFIQADSGLAVWVPQCQNSRSVAGSLILIPAVRRAWPRARTCARTSRKYSRRACCSEALSVSGPSLPDRPPRGRRAWR